MINTVGNINFNGIYDLRFPKGTPQTDIDKKAQKMNIAIDEMLTTREGIEVYTFDDRVRLVTSFDNPWFLTEIFKKIGGEELAKQYTKSITKTLYVEA